MIMDKLKSMKIHNEALKQHLQESQGLSFNYLENIIALEQQLEDSQSLSAASSFLRFSKE